MQPDHRGPGEAARKEGGVHSINVEEALKGDAQRPPTGRRTQDGRGERNSRRCPEWPGRWDRTGRNEGRDATEQSYGMDFPHSESYYPSN